jgi:hypothetical protein
LTWKDIHLLSTGFPSSSRWLLEIGKVRCFR